MDGLPPEENLLGLYRRLLCAYGFQNWWPIDRIYHKRHGSDPREEIVIGAVLTQNVSWRNVEQALENLKRAEALSFEGIKRLPLDKLAELIKPVGFFRRKAVYLKAVCDGIGSVEVVERIEREDLLRLRGVGYETADVILLYAGERPFFVIDSFTKRIVHRVFRRSGGYEDLRRWFESNLPRDVKLFKEFHALLDEHAKRYCRKKPLCIGCPVEDLCAVRCAGSHLPSPEPQEPSCSARRA